MWSRRNILVRCFLIPVWHAKCPPDHFKLPTRPTYSTLVGKARTNHVRVTVFYRFLGNVIYKVMKVTVGSPTQRRQPAPSVTSERGTVLVNFVGFGNWWCYSEVGWRPVAIYSLVQSRSERAKHSLRRRVTMTHECREVRLSTKPKEP
jgi:hypothetical protein